MGSSQIKVNHNQKKLKTMKETAKRHSKEDQSSPGEKENLR